MANKHGMYAYIGNSAAKSVTSAGTVAVYVGTAPVNLVKGYKEKGVVNTPVKLSNYLHAQKTVGYSVDWENFTICEAIGAHFDNKLGNIGPIYVINVLDPEIHKKNAATTKILNFVNGRAEFISDTVILDTVAIAEKTQDVDFSVDYNFTTGKVLLNSLGSTPLEGNIEISFSEVDPTLIDENAIIGGKTASGEYSGIGALPLVYNKLQGLIPNLLSALKFNENKKVYNAMVTAIQQVNDQWDAFAVADIPLTGEADTETDIYEYSGDVTGTFYTSEEIKVGITAFSNKLLSKPIGAVSAVDTSAGTVTIGEGNSETLTVGDTVKKTVETTIDTIEEAMAWKVNNAYDSERTKVFWPQVYDAGTERIFHCSTLAIVEFMRADNLHKNVPCETCSNKEIPATSQYFGKNSKNTGFDRAEANNLNEVGISTAYSDGGKMKLWGGHTAKFRYGSDDDVRCVFDTYMRTLMHLENTFQKRNGAEIDKPFTPAKRDSILNYEQNALDDLVAIGALVGEPKIYFLASENSTEDMIQGDFKFNIPVTTTPQFKSATAEVNYTDEGLSSLTEGVE